MLLNMVMFKVTICDIGKMNINMTDKIEKKEATFAMPYNGAENGGYPPTQNGDIRSLFWLFSLMALQN